MVRCNVRFDVINMDACDCAFVCRYMYGFGIRVESFLSFRLMPIQTDMDHRHRAVGKFFRGILTDAENHPMLMPALGTFSRRSA